MHPQAILIIGENIGTSFLCGVQRAFDTRLESTRLDRIRWLAEDHVELSREGRVMWLQLQGKRWGQTAHGWRNSPCLPVNHGKAAVTTHSQQKSKDAAQTKERVTSPSAHCQVLLP